MVANRHCCCICNVTHKDVQIHHIDNDNSNNAPENLAVLCLDCHSKVTSDGGLGRSYSPGEVASYKTLWEERMRYELPTNRAGRGSSERVFGILRDTQDGETPLSALVVDALELAKTEKDERLIAFCNHELKGWRETHDEVEGRLPTYRMCACFVSRFRIDIEDGIWAGKAATVWKYIKDNKDRFTDFRLFMSCPIAELERISTEASLNDQAIIVVETPAQHAFPDSEMTGPVYFYLRQDDVRSVLGAIRVHLSDLLLAALHR